MAVAFMAASVSPSHGAPGDQASERLCRRIQVWDAFGSDLSQEYAVVPGLQVLGTPVYASRGGHAAFLRRPGRDVWAVVRLHGRLLESFVDSCNFAHRLFFDEQTAPEEFQLDGQYIQSDAKVWTDTGPDLVPYVIVDGAAQPELNGRYLAAAPDLSISWASSPTFWGPEGRNTHFLHETAFRVFAISPAACFRAVHSQVDCGDLLFLPPSTWERRPNGSWLLSAAHWQSHIVFLHVTGATGRHAQVINGVYRPSQELFGERPFFQKHGDKEHSRDLCICYFPEAKRWMHQPRRARGTDRSQMSSTSTTALLPSEVTHWRVYVGGGKWEAQPVQVSLISEMEVPALLSAAEEAPGTTAPQDSPKPDASPSALQEQPSQSESSSILAQPDASSPALQEPPSQSQRSSILAQPDASLSALQEPPSQSRSSTILAQDGHASASLPISDSSCAAPTPRGRSRMRSRSMTSTDKRDRKAARSRSHMREVPAGCQGQPCKAAPLCLWGISEEPAQRNRGSPEAELPVLRRPPPGGKEAAAQLQRQPPEAELELEELRQLVATWDSPQGGTNLQEAWHWYEQYFNDDHSACGLEPLRVRGLRSDFKVAFEVLGRHGYRPPRAGADFVLFGIVPGDRVLDGGGNIGAYAHWAVRQGAAHVDVYEPAWVGSTWQQLQKNCRDPRFTLHPCGLSTCTGTDQLLDLEAARAGASRSTVSSLNVYQGKTWTAGSWLCEIDVVDFDTALPGHHVVKLDMEGSELPILDRVHRWGLTRVLHVEYSANRCRSDEGEPWQRFANCLKRLEEGGWTHVFIPGEVYKQRFWAKHGGRNLDFNFWGFREQADRKWGDRIDWKSLDMDSLEELRTKWRHFSTMIRDPCGL